MVNVEDDIRIEHNKGQANIYPNHKMVKNYTFEPNEIEEAKLAHHIAVVAEKNGLSANDLSHLFPVILRMLKSDIPWAG